ncbi:hypothetical protein [Streptomyces sp. NPDC002490]|uniref:hypothetical protein n=1 Tax=Streptomyces sp. NPDC002490 TaxID=3154416 RepID=UPI00331C1F5D
MAISLLRRSALSLGAVALSGLAVTGVTVSPANAAPAAPAASGCSYDGGARYICAYGISKVYFPDGRIEEFHVGTDWWVYSRITSSRGGNWSNWKPTHGMARSPITVHNQQTWYPRLTIVGNDGNVWYRQHDAVNGWGTWHRQ